MKLPLELLYNLRLLRKNVGFVAICVLMIGLGMGISITMYSIADNSSTKQYPFPHGDRFVAIYGFDNSTNALQLQITDGHIYQTLAASVQSFETFGAYRRGRAIFSDGEVTESFQAVEITPDLLQTTGVVPILGRSLVPSDDIQGADPVAVISYRLWQSYYAGRQDIVGTVSRINGNPRTIVGVMPEGFTYPMWYDVWSPLQLPAGLEPGESRGLDIMGVLADGVGVDSTDAEINSLMLQLSERLPQFYGDLGGRARVCCTIINYEGPAPGEFLLPVLTLSLLLLVSLNVANLILVRTNQRIHEFTIRSALGATRRRLIQVVLQDSLLICLLGSLLGLVLGDLGMAYVGSAASEALASEGGLPFTFNFGWELPTVITALATILLIWILSVGLAIWQIARQDLSINLAGGKSGATDSRGAFGTATIVSVEIVFSCFLLVLTVMLIGTSIELADADYGTPTEGYLTGEIELPVDRYGDPIARELYQQNLQQELIGEEGIEAVSFTTALPSHGGSTRSYGLEDRDVRVDNEYPRQGVVHVANNYFETMELTLRSGRSFDSADTVDSLPVVIVDELFARQLWPDRASPEQIVLGQRIEINPGQESSEWLTIVGVTPHIIQGTALNGRNIPSLYRPLSQGWSNTLNRPFDVSVVLKVTGDPNSFRQPLQLAAARVDRDIPISVIYTLEDWLGAANSVVVFAAEASSGIALITLALAITGIFAIVSRSVRQRTREIGIRRAIGSSDANVLWVFIRQGFKYLVLGLLIGGGGAVLIINAISPDQFTDLLAWLPFSMVSVSLGLSLLVLIATYTPARQLVAMEPGETLRDE